MKRIYKLILLIEALLIVLTSNTVYYSTGKKNIILFMLIVITLLLIPLSILCQDIVKINRKNFNTKIVILIIENTIMLFFLLIHSSSWSTLGSQVTFIAGTLVVFDLFSIYFIITQNTLLLNYLIIVVKIISAISLFFYIFSTVLGIISATDSVQVTWGGEHSVPSFYNLYFETQKMNFFGFLVTRNSGVFVEAPMFGLVLCITMGVKILILKMKLVKSDIILVITIITTFSTMAILLTFCLLSFLYFKGFIEKGTIEVIISMFVLSIIVILVLPNLRLLLFSKYNSVSGSLRIDDYISGFYAWKLHPFIGNGWNSNDVIAQFMNTASRNQYLSGGLVYNTGLANSITPVLSDGGILLALFYVIPLFYAYTSTNSRLFVVYFCFLMLLSIFNYIPIMFILLSLLINLDDKLIYRKMNVKGGFEM